MCLGCGFPPVQGLVLDCGRHRVPWTGRPNLGPTWAHSEHLGQVRIVRGVAQGCPLPRTLTGDGVLRAAVLALEAGTWGSLAPSRAQRADTLEVW